MFLQDTAIMLRKRRATIGLIILISAIAFNVTGCLEQTETESPDTDTESTPKQSRNTSDNRGQHLLIGTGSVRGAYFPVGGVICRLLNRHQSSHRMRCSLESTGGSIYNLRQLREDNFDVVFAQSDWQYHAYHGTNTFEQDGPDPQLRAIFALEPDPLALIVRMDSPYKAFDHLEDQTVSFGYTRSLQRRTIDHFMQVKGWSESNFKEMRRIADNQQVPELCAGKVDAILLLGSSLNDHLKSVPDDCELRFLPIQGKDVDNVIAKYPYYRKGYIPKGRYINSSADAQSFGLGATFVAHQSTSPKAVYYIVKEVAENFRDFKSLHPSLSTLEKRDLPYAGIAIPLHAGALQYYREARLVK